MLLSSEKGVNSWVPAEKDKGFPQVPASSPKSNRLSSEPENGIQAGCCGSESAGGGTCRRDRREDRRGYTAAKAGELIDAERARASMGEKKRVAS